MNNFKMRVVALITLVGIAIGAVVIASPRPDDIPKNCKAVIYVDDPLATLEGRSKCGPCNQLVQDLKKKFRERKTGERIVGLSSYYIFQIRKAPKGVRKTPLVVYYYDNGTKDWIDGYSGDYRAIAAKHPFYAGRKDSPMDSNLYLVSADASGFSPRESSGSLRFLGEEQEAPQDNFSPFIPEYEDEKPFVPTVPKKPDRQVAQVFYAQNCAASYGAQNCAGSYSTPYNNCAGGGGGMIGGGGGFVPSYAPVYQPTYQQQVYRQPVYQPVYRQPIRQTYPVYAMPSYGYNAYSGGGNIVCGPDGCYRVN